MAIIQQPDALSLSGNLKKFIVSSGETVSFVLKDGSTVLLDATYEPGSDSRVTIDVQDIVESRLSFLITHENFYQQQNVVKTFTAVIDGTEYTFRAIRAGVANLGDTPGNWLKGNFLTWQPTAKPVTYYSPEWLTYYAVEACTIKLKATFPDNTVQNFTLGACEAGKAFTVNLQYAVVSGLLGQVYPSYYEVWAEKTGGTRLTYIQRYMYSEPKSEQEQWFLFENSLGGLDTIRAYGDTDFEGAHEHKIASIDGVSSEYRIDTQRFYNKNTGYLDEYERRWLLDFFPSRTKSVYFNSAFRKIVVSESDVKYAASDLPSSYNFKYRFADDSAALLTLIRNEDAIPENITIPDLSSPDFSLPPRLSEYPRVTLSEGVILPAFDPFSETPKVTSFGAIRDEILSKVIHPIYQVEDIIGLPDALAEISGSSHSHPNKTIIDQLTQGNLDVLSKLSLDNGNLKIDANAYSTGELSAYGLGSGGSSGGGVDLLQAWADYDITKDNWAVKAGLLVPFYNDAKSRLTSLEGGAALSLNYSGSGNGVSGVSKSGTVLTVTKANFAELDVNGKILSSQLPSYVDDVLEYVNLAAFPATGETGKIYIAQDSNKTYRWSGTAYVEISASLALGETSSTAYRGDRGKTAYDHSQLTGNPHGTTFAQIVSRPTTITGYGITDAYTKTEVNSALTSKLDKSVFDDLFEKVEVSTGVFAIKAKYNFYGVGEISAYGLGAGGSGGGGVDLLQAWTDYDITKDNWAVKAGLLVPFYNDATSRLSALEGGAALSLSPVGSGNGIASITKSGTVLTVTKVNFAELDVNGKILSSQLPSYVDDVLEYVNLAVFPATGETGKIYIAQDSNKTYRWSGTAYVEISASLALGETSSTAYRGDRGKTAYDHSQLTGNPHGTTFAQIVSRPTTITGYGITDAYTKTEVNSALTSKLDKSVFDDLFEKVEVSTGVFAIKAKYNFYGVGEISAYGLGAGGSGGGSYDRLDAWADYNSTKAGWVLSAFLGNELNSRVGNLEGRSALTVNTTGAGNAITSISKAGTVITATKGATFSLDGHTHSYLPISGGAMSGTITSTISGTTALLHKASGTGTALARIGAASYDKGIGVSNTGELIFGDWSDVSNLSSTWSKIYHSGNFNPASYLPLSGGTLTGNLTAPSFIGALSGNATTSTNISNSGTVTLASAIESNSITINQPSYIGGQPVKLLNFNWYATKWSLGNIRGGGTNTQGLGVYLDGIKMFTFRETGHLEIGANTALHTGNYSTTLDARYVTLSTVQTITAQKTFSDGDANYGINAKPSIILGGNNTTNAGAIKLWGNVADAYALIQTTTSGMHIDMSSSTGNIYIGNYTTGKIGLINNVGIGKIGTADYALDVNGSIFASRLVIGPANTNTISAGATQLYFNNDGATSLVVASTFIGSTITNSGNMELGAINRLWKNVYANLYQSGTYNWTGKTAGFHSGTDGYQTGGFSIYNGTGTTANFYRLDNLLILGRAANQSLTIDTNSNVSILGNTTTNRIVLSSVAAEAQLEFSRPSYNYLTAPLNGGISFITNGDSPSALNSMLVLSPNGYVGVGKGFTNNTTAITAQLHVRGNILSTGEITAYVASDRRLKHNIAPLFSSLDIIGKLNPVSYYWNQKAKELNPMKSDSLDYGLIAQEVENVLPGVVHGIFDDKYKSIDYIKLIPIMIAAIKELKQKVNKL